MSFYLMTLVLNVASAWWLLQRPPGLVAPLLCIAVVLAVLNLSALRQFFWTYVYPHLEDAG